MYGGRDADDGIDDDEAIESPVGTRLCCLKIKSGYDYAQGIQLIYLNSIIASGNSLSCNGSLRVLSGLTSATRQ
jgi:hypothetical protein